jgi:hypothetical protein
MKRRSIRPKVAPLRAKTTAFLLPAEKQSWSQRLKYVLTRLGREFNAEPGMHLANHETVQRTLRGIGPDSTTARPECGVRMVVNISSAHIPAFCSDGYKNAYDLAKAAATKGSPDGAAPRVSARRQRVDQALPLGPGMHYYGDICLVLKSDAVATDTVVLDRNSFDVDRPPAADRVKRQPALAQGGARASILSSWSGRWSSDLAAMTTLRMHAMGATSSRRWTIGHVARALVDDEDYVEVLKQGSFAAGDIQEARLFSADVALEAHIASRVGKALQPRLEDLIWRRRRVLAEVALGEVGIPVRVVTHTGRERG